MGAMSADLDVESLRGRRATARWNRTSVADLFERVCWSYPDKEAIVAGAGAYANPSHARLTYRQADRLANRFGNALLREGLQPGDRLAFLCENSVEAYIAKIGAAKAGIVCAPINPRLNHDVQASIIERVAPGLLLADAEFLEQAASLASFPIIVLDIGGPVARHDGPSFDDFIAGAPETEPDVELHADDIWQLLPTSGTTAMPKLVMQSHQYAYIAAYTSALTYTRGLRFEADLRLCCLFPVIYHASDQAHTFPAFICGGTLVLGRQNGAEETATLVTAARATALFGGSSGFLRDFASFVAANRARFDLSNLTSITYTWAPVAPATADALKQMCGGDVMLTGHLGQTEVLSTTRFWPDRWPEIYRATAPKVNHVGVPNPLLAAAIRTEDGRMLEQSEANQPGEFIYRTPAVASGYFHDLEATRAAFEGGWFHSGDCGIYDENGLMVMVDRYKDMIKTGGENVSTIRVEAVLLSHPAVARAAVAGLPHARWSEAVAAFVVLAAGASCDEAELIAFCRARLAGFETPKAVIILPDLPHSVGGKVQKHLLRQAYADHFAAQPQARPDS